MSKMLRNEGFVDLDGKYDEALRLSENAKGLDLSDEERTRRQFVPRLGDHLKTGHRLSVQNRPTGLA
jgi:hypothetical protein